MAQAETKEDDIMNLKALDGWEFVVWSFEGKDGYSVCLHRGELLSHDHVCIGYQPTKEFAEQHVQKGNEWLAALRAALRLAPTTRLDDAQKAMDEFAETLTPAPAQGECKDGNHNFPTHGRVTCFCGEQELHELPRKRFSVQFTPPPPEPVGELVGSKEWWAVHRPPTGAGGRLDYLAGWHAALARVRGT